MKRRRGVVKEHIHQPFIYRIDGDGEHHKCLVCKQVIVPVWREAKRKGKIR
jgi:hypothetical protein